MAKEIKWSQWSEYGMMRCGHRDLKTLMEWMRDLGRDAKKCLKDHDLPHAIYGRVMHDDEDNVAEVRFYCDVYVSDEDLDKFSRENPHDTFYVAHKLT